MLLVADLPEGETIAPEVSAAAVLRIEVLGVDAVDTVQGTREAVPEALDDEVVVVRHQAEREHAQVIAVDGDTQLRQEPEPVVAVSVDRLARDAPCGHVPEAVLREGGAREASHLARVEPRSTAAAGWGHIGTEMLRRTCPNWTCPGTVPRQVPFGRAASGQGRRASIESP